MAHGDQKFGSGGGGIMARSAFGGGDSSEKQRIALAEQQAALTRTSFSRRAAQDVAAREKVARDAGPQKPANRRFLSGSFPGIEAAFEAEDLKGAVKGYLDANQGEATGKFMLPFPYSLVTNAMNAAARGIGGMMPFGKQDPLGDPYNPYTTKGVQVPGADPGVLGSLTWEQNAKLFGGGVKKKIDKITS